jgi:hypothetical protein
VYETYEARKLQYVLPINLIFTRDRLYASVLRHILGQFKCAGALEIMRPPPPSMEPWCQLAEISAAETKRDEKKIKNVHCKKNSITLQKNFISQ